MQKAAAADNPVRTRDPERTRGKILEAALVEFAENGYDGAKVQKIASSAGCNARLIYHYFDNKDRLYMAALQRIYSEIRAQEEKLRLEALPPEQAITRLVETTFDFFENNPVFLAITRSENLLGGRFVAQMPEIQKMSAPFLKKVADVLSRGSATGVFRPGVDPLQLYVSIVALSAHHINAGHTLSATFGTDLSCETWRRKRRQHVVDMIVSAVRGGESSV
ncbi:TetR/AcrR family transcriptional regulator [Roseobacter sinensis]|uniref:TetR family transcriptional regulator n=1 Tax=Roseobacter sinensis TaxID=2931391 RepID=A0ABT3BCE1_9RHOB|nr:TetR/AcrR family transcriptional regulator [Roseobacter sp. WL0113]MCV3271245.1 TetR family transcriptional regulator [Roseobacter sp. WL0113]